MRLINKFANGYVIKKGDTLSGIAHKYGLTLKELMNLNGITDSKKYIYAGNTLIVEKDSKKSETSEKSFTPRSGYTDTQNMQQWLWDNGYYRNGLSEAREVDNVIGNRTRKAIQLAKNDGWLYKNKKWTKKKSSSEDTSSSTSTTPSTSTNTVIAPITKTERTDTTSTYTPWTPGATTGSVQKGIKTKIGAYAYAYDTRTRRWVPTDECAQWANDSLRRYVDSRGRTLYTPDNIGGDAWTRLSSSPLSQMVISGYSGTTYNPRAYSESSSNTRNHAAADTLKNALNGVTLDPSRTYLVNMYFDKSPNKQKAWEGATNGTTGTHTGNLYFDGSVWRVAHNIHGKVYDEPLSSVLGSNNGKGYGVTAISTAPRRDYTQDDIEASPTFTGPRSGVRNFYKKGGRLIPRGQNGLKTGINYDPDFQYDIAPAIITNIDPRHAENAESAKFIKSLNDNRNAFMRRYNLTDSEYADLASTALNLAKKETDFGRGERYQRKEAIGDLGVAILKGMRSLFTLEKPTPLSHGITQIKDNIPELSKEYKAIGIKRGAELRDPAKSAKATIARLNYGRNTLELNNGKQYHYTNGRIIPEDTGLAMWWNYGSLTDDKNPDISNLDVGGATGYARRFEKGKVVGKSDYDNAIQYSKDQQTKAVINNPTVFQKGLIDY